CARSSGSRVYFDYW
nr:immunoglobulin heavy chain junction region [Mus musculus]